MSTKTTNYELVKPAYSEAADVKVINDNMDIIDDQMKANADGVSDINGWLPSGNGTEDQILRTNGDGTTRWDNAATQTEIGNAVTAWLGEHATQSETYIEVEDTLTVSGAAADSKTVGDRLGDLKSALSDNTGTEIIPINETGKYIQMTGDVAVLKTSANFKYSKIACQEGDIFTVNAEGAGGARCWGWLTAQDGVIRKAAEGESVTDKVMVAPENSAYLVINNKVMNSDLSYKGRIIKNITDQALIFEDNPSEDLDDFVKLGYYVLGSSTTYTHSPEEDGSTFTGARMLYSFPSFVDGSTYIAQIMLVLSSTYEGNIYARRRVANAWGEWTKVSSIKDMGYCMSLRDITGITDLNNADKSGYYVLSSSYSYSNLPTILYPPEGTSMSGAKTLKVFTNKNGSYIEQELWVLSSTYAGCIYVRRKSAGTWTSWMTVYSKNDVDRLINAKQPTISETFEPFSIASQGENKGIRIKAMSYNVANYNNDTAAYISDKKAFEFKKCVLGALADFLMIQEDRGYIDSESTKNTMDYLYRPVFNNKIGLGGTTIYSKETPVSDGIGYYSNGRSARYATYHISESITLLVVSTHPVAGSTAEDIAARATQYQELFAWVSGANDSNLYDKTNTETDRTKSIARPSCTHCIIGMDANSVTDDDKTNLKTYAEAKNYHLGNGGFIGWFYTNLKNTYSSLDNIIVSDNIIINNIEAYSDWYDRLYSDHVPVVADLTLLDT